MSYGRYVPVPLGRWERRLCWLVWITHSAAAFIITIVASQTKFERYTFWFADSSYIADTKMDITDTEWLHFRKTVGHILIDHCLHSVIFFLIIRFVTAKWVKLALFCAGILLQIHMTSLQCILILTALSVLVTSLSIYTRHIAIPWVLCISVVLKGSEVFPYTTGDYTYYREFNVYLYGAIKILNFALHMCNNKELKYTDIWKDHLVYMAYLPYSSALIVLFDDFVGQLERRLNKFDVGDSAQLRFIGWFAVRILFWYFAMEFIVHIIYANSLFYTPFNGMEHLNNYEVAAFAYVAGQFFHMKYVVMFGIPALFAYMDGMCPPPPPICISRVSRYSMMWRHFDVGLYRFLKNQVYIPLMKLSIPPALDIVRNLGTLVAVFCVVLAWHGFKINYICWVSLSAVELIIERIGRVAWKTKYFQELSHRIGELNTRRMVAVLMLATVIPGIFGVFFFLGVEGAGSAVFKRILVDGPANLLAGNIFVSSNSAAFVFLHLVILGYFFNNVCLDYETDYEHQKAAQE